MGADCGCGGTCPMCASILGQGISLKTVEGACETSGTNNGGEQKSGQQRVLCAIFNPKDTSRVLASDSGVILLFTSPEKADERKNTKGFGGGLVKPVKDLLSVFPPCKLVIVDPDIDHNPLPEDGVAVGDLIRKRA